MLVFAQIPFTEGAGSLAGVSGTVHSSGLGVAVVVALYRLGLGWLVGRRRLLVVTSRHDGSDERISLHRYRIEDGTVRVAATPGPWRDDLAAKPVATIHGAPGPLAVTGRVSDDGRNEIVFDRTGRPAPSVIVPDRNWVIPAVVLGLALIGALWRTAGDDR